MFKINRFTLVSLVLVGAYLLSACGGALPQSGLPQAGIKVQAKEIVFTGVVEAINGNEWTVSGQVITVEPSAAVDPNIQVGMIVKVEGQVSSTGEVTALKVETSAVLDDNASGANANDDNLNANSNANTNDDNSNSANDNSNETAGAGTEIFGVVESLTTDAITVNGIEYQLAQFTEFKDAVAVGDQVKLHVIVNADGTFTIREIEKSTGNGVDDNSNNSNDDNGNESNSKDSNSNDDHGNDDSSNDDHDDDNGGGSGQGGGGDDGGNGNGNGNGG